MSYAKNRKGWNDLLGQLIARNAGLTTPTFGQIGATVFYAYNFLGTGVQKKEFFLDFHIDHKYAPGTDLYIHMHWLPNTNDTGNVKWYFNIAYAKGYNQAAFNLASPISVDVTTASPAVQYQHMISEVQFSNDGGTGGLLDSNNIETDGIIMVNAYRDPADASDTYAETAWGLYCDIHYQSDRNETVNRNFPFEN